DVSLKCLCVYEYPCGRRFVQRGSVTAAAFSLHWHPPPPPTPSRVVGVHPTLVVCPPCASGQVLETLLLKQAPTVHSENDTCTLPPCTLLAGIHEAPICFSRAVVR
ncbi:unnamed protein product, partial [Ectocarpus sp. 12 AP-2014]